MILPRTVHADATRETTKYVFWKSNVIEAARVTVEQAKPYADKLSLWFQTGEPVWMAAESLAFIVKQRAIGDHAMGSEILSIRRAIDKRSGYGWSHKETRMKRRVLHHRYGRAGLPKHALTFAREITRDVMLTSRHRLLPYEIAKKYGLSTDKAREIYDLSPSAFGPGGKGFEWMVGKVGRIIMKKG